MNTPANQHRRVVITGMGLVSPLGDSPDALWEALAAGRSGVDFLSLLPQLEDRVVFGGEARQFTGAIDDFGQLNKNLKKTIRKALKVMCRETMMAIAVAQQAAADAGFAETPMDPERSGVVFGSDYMLSPPEDFAEAIPHLKQAVELDPDYGQAWAALASIYLITYRKGSQIWSQIVNPDKSSQVSWVGARDKAEIHLRQAMRNPTPLAHQIESQISWDYRQFERALSEARQAVALDQNDPEGHLAMAWALIFSGRAEAAIASTETAIRLDPNFPGSHLFALGTAQLMLESDSKLST